MPSGVTSNRRPERIDEGPLRSAPAASESADLDGFDEMSFSDLQHRVLRRWPVVVLGALVGLVAMFVTSSAGSGAFSHSVNIRFDDLRGAVTVLELPPDLGARPLVTPDAATIRELIDELERADELGDATVDAQPLSAEGMIIVSATSSDPDEAAEAVERVVAAYEEHFLGERAGALRDLDAELAADLARIEDRTAEIGEPAGVARQVELLALEQQRFATERQRQRIEVAERMISGMVKPGEPERTSVDGGGRSLTRLAAGALLGAGVAVAILVVLAVTDRKVRRRRQVERLLPGVEFVGVVVRGPGLEELTRLGRAVALRLADMGVAAVRPVVLGDGRPPEWLAELLPVDEEADAVVVLVRSGSVSEDELSAAISDELLVGHRVVGVALIDVDRADRAWSAAASPPRLPTGR